MTGWDSGQEWLAAQARQRELQLANERAAYTERMTTEQQKVAETFERVREITIGHKRALVEAGFCEEHAEAMSAHVHATIIASWFGQQVHTTEAG